MSSNPKRAFRLPAPQISRSKAPIRHRVYTKSASALKVRAGKVSGLVDAAYQLMPWLRAEHRPLVARWAELEVIIACAFTGIAKDGMFGTDRESHEISARRLVHDYRQLLQTQTVIARELLMTPAARAQISGDSKEQLDLVALLANQPEAAAEADDGNQTDTPAPDSKSYQTKPQTDFLPIRSADYFAEND